MGFLDHRPSQRSLFYPKTTPSREPLTGNTTRIPRQTCLRQVRTLTLRSQWLCRWRFGNRRSTYGRFVCELDRLSRLGKRLRRCWRPLLSHRNGCLCASSFYHPFGSKDSCPFRVWICWRRRPTIFLRWNLHRWLFVFTIRICTFQSHLCSQAWSKLRLASLLMRTVSFLP